MALHWNGLEETMIAEGAEAASAAVCAKVAQRELAGLLGDVTSSQLQDASHELAGHPGRRLQQIAEMIAGLADRVDIAEYEETPV